MHTSHWQSAAKDIVSDILIQPRTTKEICVGIYESCIPKPDLVVKTTPHIGNLLAVTIEQKQDFGEYTLVCVIKNSSDKSCRVNILEGGLHGS